MEDEARSPDAPARRRRRAVGPPGARVAQQVDRTLLPGRQVEDDTGPDDEARLRADVPPHHGP